MKYDVDAVKQALTTIFLTNNYEKLFDPTFGIGIRSAMFELSDPVTKIALLKRIRNQLAYYEPRVVIDDLILNDIPDSNELSIDFYFHVIDRPHDTQTLTLSFDRIR